MQQIDGILIIDGNTIIPIIESAHMVADLCDVRRDIMFKKYLAVLAALALSCACLIGCVASDAGSSSSSSEAPSQSSESTQAVQDESELAVVVSIDASSLSDPAYIEKIEPYAGPQEFQLAEGASAYDALLETGVQVEGTPDYVSGIEGVGEDLAGNGSGWMYKVNDELPSGAAGDYQLQSGDTVTWYYGTWN